MYLEFVVLGTPISNQSPGLNLTTWRAAIAGAAQTQWTKPLLTYNLKAILINFYAGNKPSVDVDNLSKSILDVMQTIVYDDDRQITQAEITHIKIGEPLVIVGLSKLLVSAIHTGNQFVYVRLEDPVAPFPLPK